METQAANQPPHSGSLRAILAVNGFKSRIFLFLGSKQVELRWDVATKVVSITELKPDGTPVQPIISVNVHQIERVVVINGNYILYINGQAYDMEIQHYKGQGAIMHDLLGAEFGGLASAYVDAKSDGEQFIEFIKQELPPQLMAVSIFKSKTRIKATIGIAIAVIVILVGVGLFSATQGPR